MTALIPGYEVDVDSPSCGVCGCTEDNACPGGCIWADSTMTLCSRCARESTDAAAARHSGGIG